MSVLNRRIHVLALAAAAGLTWGLATAVLAVWVMSTDHGMKALEFLADLYPYYTDTVTGCLWGVLWGFIDAFLAFFAFGFLYNLFSGRKDAS